MTGARPFQGSLFAEDLLRHTIADLPDWQGIDEALLDGFETALRTLFERFPTDRPTNESQTEDDLIWPVLQQLGWTATLRQQNLSVRGRDDVPDGLLFGNDAAKDRANSFGEEWKRYEHGLAVVESKRWLRPLDRRSGRRGEETAPATQMLRYLRRVDDVTNGKLRWGILTNGARWRLYWQGALSVSEQFFEIDLAAILDLPAHNDGLFTLSDEDRRHWLKVFMLVFARSAFLPDARDKRTFHQRVIEEGRVYQERVAKNLSGLVFDQVFPDLVRAIADDQPKASLPKVREAALVLLYRLLFILYAEDRDLLPVRDSRYDDYGLRKKVRHDVGRRSDEGDIFSVSAAAYWSAIDDLCRAIDQGDASIGLPPYNGGLFDRERTPLLSDTRLGDAVMARVIDALSFERRPEGRRYINYRDLGVQQLGSIYERLLEQDVVRDAGAIVVRPNALARKDSGSYYTPDDLVGLIIRETIDPLVRQRMDAFAEQAAELETSRLPEDRRLGRLKQLDPAEKLLDLKVCDPAMGSGHFLVNLVDYFADRVIAAMAEAESTQEGYISPLTERIDVIRNRIMGNAEERNWSVDPAQLDDRHIVRRMVLKRCVYGVDKNPMAVELAKVSLWLHTFTAGAPLSFLDHHLRCGDSLFGSWVKQGIAKAHIYGSPLMLVEPIKRALLSASKMQIVEGLTDVEISEAHRSADVFADVEDMTAPLDALLCFIHALDWIATKDKAQAMAIIAFFDGEFGDPVDIIMGKHKLARPRAKDAHENMKGRMTAAEKFDHFASIFDRARGLADDEGFLNWQVTFPGVWSDWEDDGLTGGFDAVIGNPPWDRMKLQQVEWFAARRPEIAHATRAADRKRMIDDLEKAEDPLASDFAHASEQVAAAIRMVRKGGDYPLLSGGDVNLYSLFVERAMTLVKPDGMVGLLVPSGIASDKTAARFFKGVSTQGRLRALYDFENKKIFFPDVHASFKFCIFVTGPTPTDDPAQCAFFLQDVSELDDPERCFPLTPADFARVNPNTGTAPIFRTRRDADLTTAIYDRLPVLVDRSSGQEVKAWPVKYTRMFDMTNDSGLFRTREELDEKEGAYPVAGNRFGSPAGEWVPLYEGKMVQAFDHRAASIVVNPKNRHRPAQPMPATEEQHQDPAWLPDPQFWVLSSECGWREDPGWVLGFKDVTAATNVRSMIATIIPGAGAGNTLPIVSIEKGTASDVALLLANYNAISFDFVARQKIQGQHLNWFIIEQLPVVSPDRYETAHFGSKTAGDILREIVLELTYTAHDMAPFAHEMGHVDKKGAVLRPFPWDEERRLRLRAKLDAVYFHLYGVTAREDVRHVYATFPIVKRQEREAYGSYLSRDLCLAWMNALAAGNPDANIKL